MVRFLDFATICSIGPTVDEILHHLLNPRSESFLAHGCKSPFGRKPWLLDQLLGPSYMAVCQNPVLVNIKIGGWMFIHPKVGSP